MHLWRTDFARQSKLTIFESSTTAIYVTSKMFLLNYIFLINISLAFSMLNNQIIYVSRTQSSITLYLLQSIYGCVQFLRYVYELVARVIYVIMPHFPKNRSSNIKKKNLKIRVVCSEFEARRCLRRYYCHVSRRKENFQHTRITCDLSTSNCLVLRKWKKFSPTPSE